jgi:hypothetical protein
LNFSCYLDLLIFWTWEDGENEHAGKSFASFSGCSEVVQDTLHGEVPIVVMCASSFPSFLDAGAMGGSF